MARPASIFLWTVTGDDQESAGIAGNCMLDPAGRVQMQRLLLQDADDRTAAKVPGLRKADGDAASPTYRTVWGFPDHGRRMLLWIS